MLIVLARNDCGHGWLARPMGPLVLGRLRSERKPTSRLGLALGLPLASLVRSLCRLVQRTRLALRCAPKKLQPCLIAGLLAAVPRGHTVRRWAQTRTRVLTRGGPQLRLSCLGSGVIVHRGLASRCVHDWRFWRGRRCSWRRIVNAITDPLIVCMLIARNPTDAPRYQHIPANGPTDTLCLRQRCWCKQKSHPCKAKHQVSGAARHPGYLPRKGQPRHQHEKLSRDLKERIASAV